MSLNTVVACLKKGDEQAALEAYRPLADTLPPHLTGRINAIMLINRRESSAASYSFTCTAKRMAVCVQLPDLLKREWETLCACNKPEAQNKALFLRAKARSLEILSGSPRSFLEKQTDISMIIFSYLDLKEFGRLSNCSSRLNYSLAEPNPRIWKAVAQTFSLRDKRWPVFSRAQAKENFALLQRMNEAFKINAQQGLFKFRAPNFQLPIREEFKKTVLPLMQRYTHFDGHPAQSDFYWSLFQIADYPIPQRISSFLELYVECGVLGDQLVTKRYEVRGVPITPPRFIDLLMLADDPAKELASILRIGDDGDLPSDFFQMLFKVDTLGVLNLLGSPIPREKAIALLQKLLAHGVKISDFGVETILRKGLLHLLEPLHNAGVLRPLAYCLDWLFQNGSIFTPENAQDILSAIEILRYPNSIFIGSTNKTIFYHTALAESPALMERVLSFVRIPNHAKDEALLLAIKEKRPLFVIALMVKFGARPSREACQAVQAYSDNREIQLELSDLLTNLTQQAE